MFFKTAVTILPAKFIQEVEVQISSFIIVKREWAGGGGGIGSYFCPLKTWERNTGTLSLRYE